MTTDRELLELAARAAGYRNPNIPAPNKNSGLFLSIGHRGKHKLWSPLTDDGDALRLAVKLQLNMWIGDGGTDVRQDDRPYLTIREYAENNDPYAATRRAIVRAAAEIGKGMK